MLVLNLVFSILAAYVIGAVFLDIIFFRARGRVYPGPKEMNLFISIPVSYFLGLFFITLMMSIFSLAGLSFSYRAFYIVSLCFLGFYLFLKTRRPFCSGSHSERAKEIKLCGTGKTGLKRTLLAVFMVLIIANILIVVFFTYIYPVKFWDAISSYSLKARAFFIDGNILTFYRAHDYEFSHYSYPLFLPLVQTWTYQWLDMGTGQGLVNEVMTKTVFIIFYIMALLSMFGLLKKKFSNWLALLLTFIFSSLPIIIDHGYIEYNNLVFSIVLLLSCYFFYRWIRSVDLGVLVLSSALFSLLALIRTEGMVFSLLFIVLNIIILATRKEKMLNREKFFKSILSISVPVVILVFSYLPWFILRKEIGVPFLSMEWLGSGLQQGEAVYFDAAYAAKVFFSQVLFNAYDSTRAYFGSSYGPAWVVLIALLFVNPGRSFKDYNWVYPCFILAGLASVFISIGFIQEFGWSVERYLLSVFPLSFYWVLKSFKT